MAASDPAWRSVQDCESGAAGPDPEALIERRYQGRRILIVEDEPVNRGMLRIMLDFAGLVTDSHRYRIQWLFLAVTGLALLAYAGYSHLVEECRVQIFSALALMACFGLPFYQHRQRAFDSLAGSRRHILATSEARFRCLTEMSSDFYWETDAEHRFTERTESYGEAADPVFQRTSLIGCLRWEVPHLSPDEAGWQAHRAVLEAHLPFRGFEISRGGAHGAVHHLYVSGDPVFDAGGRFAGYIGVHQDISEIKKAQERIENLAFFDQLTGLPNRILLLDRLKQARAASSRNESRGAVLLIDLDNFKTVNDTMGHEVGDQLLKQAAQRLKQCVRTGDTVARLGGDEFVVMLANLGTSKLEAATSTEAVAQKIIDMLSDDYRLDNVTVQGTASIGVTMFKGQNTAIEDLMTQVDLAMYNVKDAGRNAFRFFDPAMESAVKERTLLEQDLRRAVEQKEFLLHYQPQVAREGRVMGAEVLVRWQHPQRGMVSPAEFIPLAEDNGLILPLGHWVMEAACAQLARWAARPETAHLTLAVNVSASQFRQDDFVQQVLAILERAGANPLQLKLELTESMLVENVEEIIEKMLALKARGVSFSLDDFGTGYSSLSYLSRLPLDQLKIDRSFVANIEWNVSDAIICAATIGLGHSLRLKVVAEGVETEAQRYFLNTVHHCDFIQGYLYSPPLPLEAFEEFIVAHPGPDLKSGLRLVTATTQQDIK